MSEVEIETLVTRVKANMRRWLNVGSLLGQLRRRLNYTVSQRWANVSCLLGFMRSLNGG